MPAKIYHAHIPKTAGTSLNVWLDDAVSFDRAKPATFEGNIIQAYRDNGVGPGRSRDLVYQNCWQLFDVLHGHGNMLPNKMPGAIAFTVFRDPVDRTISQFFDHASLTEADFKRLQPTGYAFQTDCLKLTFAELYKKWHDADVFRYKYNDYICRFFLYHTLDFKVFINLTPAERYRAALDRVMQDIDLVGFVDNMGKTSLLIAEALGLYPRGELPRHNAGRPKRTPITDADRAVIESITSADRMLFDHFRTPFLDTAAAYSVKDFETSHLRTSIQRVVLRGMGNGVAEYTMNCALLGDGFWGRDGAGTDLCCRWSGPGDDVTFYIPARGGELQVAFHIRGWVSESARTSFKIRVWDEPVGHVFVPGNGAADVAMVRATSRAGVLKFTIRCDAMTDDECGRRVSDGRRKGFALWKVVTSTPDGGTVALTAP